MPLSSLNTISGSRMPLSSLNTISGSRMPLSSLNTISGSRMPLSSRGVVCPSHLGESYAPLVFHQTYFLWSDARNFPFTLMSAVCMNIIRNSAPGPVIRLKDTKRLISNCSTLGQRQRRWASDYSALGKCYLCFMSVSGRGDRRCGNSSCSSRGCIKAHSK